MAEVAREDDITQLRRQVQELVDRNEIAALISRQGLWLDEKRFEDARSIFIDDATGEFPSGPVRGAESLAEQARRNHSAFHRTQHVTTNLLIDLDGDRATVRANLVAIFMRHGDATEPDFAIGERYRFEAVRLRRDGACPAWRSSRCGACRVRLVPEPSTLADLSTAGRTDPP